MLKIKAKCNKFLITLTVLIIALLAVASYLSVFLAVSASAQLTARAGIEPTITTDKADYSPEQIVTTTGYGFNASQVYAIPVLRPDGSMIVWAGAKPVSGWDTVTADSKGAFTYSYQLDGIAGTYTVRVYPSTWTGDWDENPIASTTFTDSALYSFTLDPSSLAIYDLGTYAINVTATLPGNSGSKGVDVYLSPNGTVLRGVDINYTSNPIHIDPYGSSGSTTMYIIVYDTPVPGADPIEVDAWDNPGTGGNIIGTFSFMLHVRQYLQTFGGSGLGVDATGSLVSFNVSGSSYSGATSPINVLGGSVWVDVNATVTYNFANPVTSNVTGKQYRLGSVTGPASGYTVSGNNTLTGNYAAQYQVSFAVNPAGAGTTTPTGSNVWVDSGPLSIQAAPSSGYNFSSWSSNTTSITFASATSASTTATVNGPGTITANFQAAPVQITVTSNPTGSGFVKVDGTAYDTPHTFTWTIGSTHSLEALSPVSGATGVQYVWASWNDSGGQTHTYTVLNSAATITANYKTQYYLTVNSVYDTPTGAGWYDSGATANFGVTSPDGTSGTRYVFTAWSGDSTSTSASASIVMNGPKSVTANWKTQYQLTVISAHDSPTPSGSNNWYDTGASATVSVTTPADESAGTRYTCTGWTGTGSVSASGTGASTTFTITAPSSITWNWMTQYLQTFGGSGLGGDATGSLMSFSVIGGSYSGATSPIGLAGGFIWVDSGATVTYAFVDPVASSVTGKQYRLGSVTGPASGYTVSGANTLTGNYVAQYLVTFKQSGSGMAPKVTYHIDSGSDVQDTVQFSVWVDSGSSITYSYESPVAGAAGTQYVLTSTNPDSPQTVNSAFDVTGTCKTQYQVSFTVSPSEGGNTTLSGTDVWEDAGTLSISATTNPGYTFSSWSSNTTSITFNNANSASTTATINGLGTITATFTQNEYTLTVNVVGNGSVAKNPDKATYHYGDIVQLTATPDSGWSFSDWSGDASGSANPVSVTIIGNMTVTATFTQNEYTLTVSVVGSGSVVKSPDQATYHYGDSVTLTATAAPGWSFAGWSGDFTSSVNPVVVVVNGSTSVTATFTQNTYTLTVSVIGSGSVARNMSGPYHYGDVVQLTANAATGASFSGWSGDLTGSANPASITIDGNKAVAATFTINTFTIIASAGPGGSISPSGSVIVSYGASQGFAIAAGTGYHIVDVLVDGVSQGAVSSYTFSNVTADHVISASFAINTYTITASAGPNGAISPNGVVTVNYGASQGFNMTANVGYHVSGVLVDGVSVGAVASYTFTNVTANHTIAASFAINTYSITFTQGGLPSGTSWSVTFGSLTQSSTTSTITFTGVTNGSYTWNVSSPVSTSAVVRYVASPLSGAMNVPVQTSQNVTYAGQYYLTVNSAYGNAGGAGWYDSGASAYATITPLTVGSGGTQYVFTGWSGDASGNGSPSNAMTMNAPKTATANWNTQYYLTVISQYGSPHGSGWYSLKSEASFGVTTPVDYGNKTLRVFLRWSGDADVSEPEGTIIMNKPSTVTASWQTQYLVTFNTTLPNTVLSIPGVPQTLPPGMNVFGMYYPANDIVAVGPAPNVVSGTAGTRYVLNGWTLDGEMFTLGANLTFVVEGPRDAAVVYGVQHLLVINAVGVSDPFTAAVTIAASTPTVRNLSPTSPIQGWLQQGAQGTLTISTPNTIGHGEWAIFKEWSEQIQGGNRSVPFAMLAPNTVNADFFKVNPVAESIPYSILAALISLFLLYAVERRRKTEGRQRLRLTTAGIVVPAVALIIAAILSAAVAVGYGINVNELLDFSNWAVIVLILAALAFLLVTIAIIRRVQRKKLLRPETQRSS
jgi:uncharacterized repeat protein (TIGR02543 family)